MKLAILYSFVLSSFLYGSMDGMQEEDPFKEGHDLFKAGEYHQAITLYEKLFKKGSGTQDQIDIAYVNYAQCKISRGIDTNCEQDWQEGWKAFDHRIPVECRQNKRKALEKQWEGQDLKGKTLVVNDEYGIGDTAGFGRYCTRAKELGAIKIILRTKGFLKDVYSRIEGVDEVVGPNDAVQDFDYDTYLMSMPRYISSAGYETTTPTTVPNYKQYLYPNPQVVKKWESKIDNNAINIAIWWRGASNVPVAGGTRVINRNMELRTLVEGIDDIEGVRLFSVQGPEHYPVREKEFRDLEHQSKLGKLDQEDIIPDQASDITVVKDEGAAFSDTLAVLAKVHLCAGIDTSLGSIAGAMGKPVIYFLKTKKDCDMRWGTKGEKTVWFPSVKLYRQEREGDWQPVIEQFKQDIVEIKHHKSSERIK